MSWGSGSYRMCKQEAEELGISSETFLHIQVLDANLHRFKNCEVEDKALERQAVLQKNDIGETRYRNSQADKIIKFN